MEKIAVVNIVTTFLEENGYREIFITQERRPYGGEFFFLGDSPTLINSDHVHHIQVMCKHNKHDLLLMVWPNGVLWLILDFNVRAYEIQMKPERLRKKHEVDLCNPNSLKLLRRLL